MAEPTAIYGAALLDPASGETARNAVVLVEEGRVVASGPGDGVAVPRDARRVDAEGLTLLPGLTDCHVHFRSLGNGRDLEEQLQTPPSLSVLNAVPAARSTLEAGFTSVRDAGGSPAGVRMATERGVIAGPRMQVAVTALSQTGGHTDQHFPCGVSLNLQVPDVPSSIVDGVEPMRQRVREVIRAGADWIKLCTSGGVLSPGDAPHHPTLTVDEIRAACEEGAAQGRRVMAHAQAAEGIKNALRGGVSTIEHGIWLDDDALEMLLDGGNALVPTLVAPLWVLRHAENGRMPSWAADKARAVFEDHKRSIGRAIEAGVTIAFGTDTGVGPHGSNGEEFLLLHELGLAPLECLRSATTVAARTIGWEGQVGTLAAGAHGDVIGVPGDPLADLDLVAKPEHVHLVVKGGEVVKDGRRRRA
ncbi:MAG: amidohydrolase family protein [bacterium]|nr:amidohydrolase family protein [bacterium]